MNKILIVTLAVFMMSCSVQALKKGKKHPNIIVLLADDLGYGDVSWNNTNAYTDTPNLDLLAKKSAILSHCYSASSMCSPSRAGLLTGRVPTRIGIHDWIKEIYKKPHSNVHLPANEVTLAEVLKQKHYQTAVFGKWHLNNEFGTGNQSDPDDQGFDNWFCTPTHALPSHKNPSNFYDHGKPVGQLGTIESPQYASQIVADKVIEWLNKLNSKLPFFLYVPFQEPHVVCDAPDAMKQKYLNRIKTGEIPLKKGTGDRGLGQAEYYACIENMDRAIGRIIDDLDSKGLMDNTFIFFSSDNGPDTNRRYKGRIQSVGETGQLKGRKRWLLEGGIRQATLLYWKDVVKAGSHIEVPVGHIDLLPTFCDIADVPEPNDRVIDGTSILPLLHGEKFERTENPLHWHFHAPRGGPQSVLRVANWVLTANWNQQLPLGRFKLEDIDVIKTAKLTHFKLYNIKNDAGQKKDIKDMHPELFQKLKSQLTEIHSGVSKECPNKGVFEWNENLQNIIDTKYKQVKD